MPRLMIVFCILLVTLSALGQSVSKYQVGTIAAVNPHQRANENASGAGSYDVSVRVGDTVYLVLYTPPLGTTSVKYAAGRSLLVRISDKTLRYNDISGQSLEVPIISRKLATDAKQSK
jgi:hypothetical protein